jgi:hypothetical protein
MTKEFKALIAPPLLLLAGLVMSQSSALADVTMQLKSEPTGYTMGGVYTSPYSIEVGGTTLDLLACDDFLTDINNNNEWEAAVLSLSDIGTTGPQLFVDDGTPGNSDVNIGSSTNVHYDAPYVELPDDTYELADGTTSPNMPTGSAATTIVQDYDAAAWLAYEIEEVLPTTTAGDTATEKSEIYGEYSYAIWQIFDPKAYLGYNGNHLTSGEQNAVQDDMVAAFSAKVPDNVTVQIYTPIYTGTSGYTYPSQEFIGVTVVPEGGTLAFLLFDFLMLPATLVLFRRRLLPKPGEAESHPEF